MSEIVPERQSGAQIVSRWQDSTGFRSRKRRTSKTSIANSPDLILNFSDRNKFVFHSSQNADAYWNMMPCCLDFWLFQFSDKVAQVISIHLHDQFLN
jgi:hypothetical protein